MEKELSGKVENVEIEKRYVIQLENNEFLYQHENDVDETFSSVKDIWNASLYIEEYLPSLSVGEEVYLEDEDDVSNVKAIYQINLSLIPLK